VKEDFVEIPNPAMTMTPNAPETIWVPRSYVESGPPRGGELVKQGYEKVTSSSTPSNEQQPAPAQQPKTAAQMNRQASPSAAAPQQGTAQQAAAPHAPFRVQSRLALLETGDNGLLSPFSEQMKNAQAGIVLDPALTASLAATADPSSALGRASLALRLQQKYGATVAIFVSGPEGIATGKSLQGAIYDGLGGELVQTVTASIPPFAAGDAAARDAAVGRALSELTQKAKATLALLPWYGKVVAVEGARAYIDAGREAGLWVGQQLVLHRPGKVVAGLGYAPGERVGTLEIAGFIGANGAYGEIRGGKNVKTDDLVTLE